MSDKNLEAIESLYEDIEKCPHSVQMWIKTLMESYDRLKKETTERDREIAEAAFNQARVSYSANYCVPLFKDFKQYWNEKTKGEL